jgi:hypothetical protein
LRPLIVKQVFEQFFGGLAKPFLRKKQMVLEKGSEVHPEDDRFTILSSTGPRMANSVFRTSFINRVFLHGHFVDSHTSCHKGYSADNIGSEYDTNSATSHL